MKKQTAKERIRNFKEVALGLSAEEALKEASKKYKLGTFLIQKVSQDESETTQRFFSMVYF
ncbi:MAG: hypothetical protein KJ864_07410 [Candidatus Omnitrophica bacterium]|nr:hypothetical protein [Candidatus Omnitrophota bacterium]